MKNKIIVKSQKILSFDEQNKKNKIKSLSILPFMEEYFRGKITPSRYLYLTKLYKD
jgi:hypothetical protein